MRSVPQRSTCKVHRRIYRYKRAAIVVRLDHDNIVKHGGPNHVRLADALTLHFIAENTSIPVPRVHDVFSARGETWLVMDYIDAPLLSDVWRHLNEQERLSSMYQLKGYVDELRALEPPAPGKVQGVDGNTCIDWRLAREPWGPFDTVDDFHQFCGHEYVYKNYPKYRDSFEKTSGRVYRTVFTHGDLGPHNIMWKDGKIVGIIDWERAGWLPEYWEYSTSYFSGPDIPSWWELFDRIMDSYPDELSVERVLGQVFTRC
ncbi:kinase-like protein [Lyophyllum atratum]|nr:kinase-like protein [Lyophyllum atratum]